MDNRTYNKTFGYGMLMGRRRMLWNGSSEIDQISFISILAVLPLVLITNVIFIAGIFKTERKLSVTNRLFVYLSFLDLAIIPLQLTRMRGMMARSKIDCLFIYRFWIWPSYPSFLLACFYSKAVKRGSRLV